MECRERRFSFQSQDLPQYLGILLSHFLSPPQPISPSIHFREGIEIPMATKFKGIFKGFKYISQIFVYKEHEMEIGYPTDVRHVSHVGWDGSSMNAPSWMNEFRTASDFSSTSLGNLSQSRDLNSGAAASWSSQDFQQSMGIHQPSAIFAGSPNTELPKVPKKTRRKKTKVSSPPSSSSSRYWTRSSKSKDSFVADEGTEGQPGLI